MVDDAHGFGVLGERGAGSTEAAGLDAPAVPVLMATLGKALGTAGAFVAGSELLIEALIQQARTYIYTTALPPAVAAASLGVPASGAGGVLAPAAPGRSDTAAFAAAPRSWICR